MTTPAAGRAGGRVAGRRSSAPDSTRTTARRSCWWTGPAAMGMVVLGTAALAPSAAAAPAPSPALPAVSAPAALLPWTAGAPADDESSDPDRPLAIEIGRLEPRTVTEGATITVTGTLTNTGGSELRDLLIRLQRGDVLTTRAELLANDVDPDPASALEAGFDSVPGVLAPGASLPFTYEVPAEELQLGADGVYPALVNVNATDDAGLVRRVGELPTFLIRSPSTPTARPAVAWLWPVVTNTSRLPDGGFADDDLAADISSGGRLDAALAVLERLPRTAPSGEADATAEVPVTMAVDPALVEELTAMAAGPYAVDGVAGAGRGTAVATEFLDRLRALAAVHPVLALPYGDVDADALSAVELPEVITRSLPGTADGTAADPLGAPAPAVEPPPATPEGEPTGDGADAEPEGAAGGTAAPEDGGNAEEPAAGPGTSDELGSPAGAGARILTEALGVQPRTDLAWAAGGSFRPDTVATLRAGGIERLVLGPAGLTGGDAALGLPAGSATAHTEVEAADGPLGVVVADAGLGSVVDTAEDHAGGPRLAEQRYLAELALLAQQAPDGSTPTVLVAPPRELDAGPEGAGAMMADTAGLPWLQAVSLDTLLENPASDGGTLTDPADAVLLDQTGLADVVTAAESRADLADALEGNPADELRAYDAATARTVSVSYRDQAEEFRAAARGLRSAFDRLLEQVTLVTPADGTYSLASGDSPLVLTLQNDLPFAVTVLVELSSRARGIAFEDMGPLRLAPDERTTLQVPTQVRQSGRIAVTAGLTTPGGSALGEPVRLQVQSTAYGTVSLLITFGSAALLALLFLRRLVHFVLRHRRGAEAEAPDAPEGAITVPPTRSPV